MNVTTRNPADPASALDPHEDLIDPMHASRPAEPPDTFEVAPPVSAPAPGIAVAVGAATARPPSSRARILDGLLRMADSYRDSGSLRQAIEMYFELIHDHDGESRAVIAEERLLDIARSYEEAGELRQARSIYEHLL